MNQMYKVPCIPYQDGMMGILKKEVLIQGTKGKTRRTALFDSGASYSIIRKDIAESIEAPISLPDGEIWEFETAIEGSIFYADSRVILNFFFDDSEQRFTDEFIIFGSCSEEIVIGSVTMQKWRIKLDFEKEEVIYRKTAQRLIVI